MRTPIDAFYVQHYLPDKNDLLFIEPKDPKNVYYYRTVDDIMPENFLKEYGAIQDENVLSIQTILQKTKELVEANKRMRMEQEKRMNQAYANAAFNRIIGGNRGRYRQF